MKKILVVAPFFIYPANHGGKIDTLNSLIQLKDTNVPICVDLIYYDYKEADTKYIEEVKKVCNLNEIKYIQLKKYYLLKILGIFYWKPAFTIIHKKLAEIVFKQSYDIVIVHGLYVDRIMDNKSLQQSKFILRVHNDEFLYAWKKLVYKKNLIKRVYAALDALKIKFRQINSFRKADKLLFISKAEYDLFHKDFGTKSKFLPTYFSDFFTPSYKDFIDRENNVLFIGSLGIEFNIKGLIWYLEKIHPHIKSCLKKYKFIIAGNTWSTDISWLQELIKDDISISLYLNPQNIKNLYFKSAVFINPMQSGAGLKIKTIDAILHGLPVVSTTVGSEGAELTDIENCFIADSEEKFIERLKQLLVNKELSYKLMRNAQIHVNELFNNTTLLKEIINNCE